MNGRRAVSLLGSNSVSQRRYSLGVGCVGYQVNQGETLAPDLGLKPITYGTAVRCSYRASRAHVVKIHYSYRTRAPRAAQTLGFSR